MRALRPARPAAHRAPRRARGQRRHRQDLRARRPGHPLRRRGRGDARRDAADHVRPGRQPGAARAGPRPARRGRARRSTTRPRRDDNELLAHLVTRHRRRAGQRRRRLRDALAGFDAATIATTHQFCQLVLRSLGVAGDTDAGVTLVESLDELVAEIVDDLYLQRFGDVEGHPAADPRRRRSSSPARSVAQPAHAADPGRARRPRSTEGVRVDFADAVLRRARAAQAPARHPRLRRPADPARRRARGPTTPRPGDRMRRRWSDRAWSTSSRTPTRCSGR